MELESRLVDCKPFAMRETVALVCRNGRSGLDKFDLPIYSICDRARELRDLRKELGIVLRIAARALGLHASHLTGLETGAKTFRTESDWLEAIDTIKKIECARPVVVRRRSGGTNLNG